MTMWKENKKREIVDINNDFEEILKSKYGMDKESAYLAYINDKEDEVLSNGIGCRRTVAGSKNTEKDFV